MNPWRKIRPYLLPGLKRWIILLAFGLVAVTLGLALLLELRPLTNLSTWAWQSMRWVAKAFPPAMSGTVMLLVGGTLLSLGMASILRKMLNIALRESPSLGDSNLTSQIILTALDRAHKRGRGPKIVAIGGGTGLSNLLRGLKSYSSKITAIVAVGDDGGSSGRLREELQVVPPGDLRNCIVALSQEEEVTTSLFQYRFTQGTLAGHNLGNLFLAALSDICGGDMSKAARLACQILRTEGEVLPSSLSSVELVAEFEDGTVVEGESKIPFSGKKIKELRIKNRPTALPETVEAIGEADLIVIAPGSLYTSILPNLIIPEIKQALLTSSAKKMYVCNLVCDAETNGYKSSDFVLALNQHMGMSFLDAVLLPSTNEPNRLEVDFVQTQRLVTEVVLRAKLEDTRGNARHSPLRLARSIFQWYLGAMKGSQERVLTS